MYFVVAVVLGMCCISHAKIYAITGANNAASSLYEITDLNTCAMTLIGSTGLSHVTGLAIDPTNGNLYAHSNTAIYGNGQLYLLNKATGAATFIGNTGHQVPDMTFDSSGQLYAWTENNDELIRIDKNTGAVTLVGSSVGTGNTGLSFTPSGVLYLKLDISFYTIDKTTGVGTYLYDLDRPSSNILEWVPALNAFISGDHGYGGSDTQLFSFNPLGSGTTTTLGLCSGFKIGAIAADQNSLLPSKVSFVPVPVIPTVPIIFDAPATIIFTVQVSAITPSTPTPGGTVNIIEVTKSSLFCQATLVPTTTVGIAQGSCSIVVPQGNWAFDANYLGDASYLSSSAEVHLVLQSKDFIVPGGQTIVINNVNTNLTQDTNVGQSVLKINF